MPSCRSSGVLTSSQTVFSGKCKLISIHACEVGGASASLKVWDNASAASGKELARIILTANQTVEFDMHGVICSNGLYFEETSGSVAVSIEFA